MAFELIEERLISGKGILLIPQPDLGYRSYSLYAQLVRRPKQEYLNFSYNPPRSRYANLVLLREGYVVEEHALEYPKQRWDFVPDVAGQALIALKCAYQGILQSFVNQNIALNLVVLGVINSIAEYTTIPLYWDEIRVVCYGSTAVSLRLYGEPYEACDPNFNVPGVGAPTPEDIPEVSPDTPLTDAEGVSPPYNEDTNDDGDTEPFPTDGFEVPPEQAQCAQVIVSYQAVLPSFGTLARTSRVFAPATAVRISPTDPTGVQCFCRAVTAGGVCLPQDWYNINSFAENLTSVSLVSVTLAPP